MFEEQKRGQRGYSGAWFLVSTLRDLWASHQPSLAHSSGQHEGEVTGRHEVPGTVLRAHSCWQAALQVRALPHFPDQETGAQSG